MVTTLPPFSVAHAIHAACTSTVLAQEWEKVVVHADASLPVAEVSNPTVSAHVRCMRASLMQF